MFRAGELSEKKDKNCIFFIGHKTTCSRYGELLSWACSFTVIVIIFRLFLFFIIFFLLYALPWLVQEKNMDFNFPWNPKKAILMLFENKYKRNWIVCHEREGWERGDSTQLQPTCIRWTLFSISHANTKYTITSIHATWT